MHEIVAGRGDAPRVRVEFGLQGRRGRASDRGKSQPLHADVASPLQLFEDGYDDLGAGAAGRPTVVHDAKAPRLADRFGDRLDVQWGEPDRVDHFGLKASILEIALR